MAFAFDADVLSTFAKIRKFGLLGKVFGKNGLMVPSAVLSDLKRSKSGIANDVLESKIFKAAALSSHELDFAKDISRQNPIHFAESLNIIVIDLETILRSLKDIISAILYISFPIPFSASTPASPACLFSSSSPASPYQHQKAALQTW